MAPVIAAAGPVTCLRMPLPPPPVESSVARVLLTLSTWGNSPSKALVSPDESAVMVLAARVAVMPVKIVLDVVEIADRKREASPGSAPAAAARLTNQA